MITKTLTSEGETIEGHLLPRQYSLEIELRQGEINTKGTLIVHNPHLRLAIRLDKDLLRQIINFANMELRFVAINGLVDCYSYAPYRAPVWDHLNTEF